MEKFYLKFLVLLTVIAIPKFVQCQVKVEEDNELFGYQEDNEDNSALKIGAIFNRLCNRRCQLTCNSRGEDPAPCVRGRCTCLRRTSK
jgi:hypothetical protein